MSTQQPYRPQPTAGVGKVVCKMRLE